LLSIQARDEPGALGRVTRLMGERRINLRGFVVDGAGVHLLTDAPAQATAALDAAKFRYKATPVHEVLLEDRAGSLAELCDQLASAGINIVTAFGVATGGAGRLYIQVSDLARAAPILNAMTQGRLVASERLRRI
jgi:hypothetical protein